jgi:hypothetical protein
VTRRIQTRARRWLLAGGLLVAASPGFASAQGLTVLSPHFGALNYPVPEPLFEVGLSFDRFTEHTKSDDSLRAGAGRRVPHYMHRRTDGFNTAHFSRVSLTRFRGVLKRATGFAGWIGEAPSRELQNQFRHHDSGLEYIPVDKAHRGGGYQYGITLGVDRWFRSRASKPSATAFPASLFTSLDGTVSSLYHEAALQVGLRSHRWMIRNYEVPSISVMVRKSFAVNESHWHDTPSRRFADSALANTYTMSTVSVRVPFDHWFDPPALIPALEFGLTSSTGLFRGFESLADYTAYQARIVAGDDPGLPPRVAERFCTIALLWGGGDVTLETYNDTCDDKDIGPSFGARIFVRWRNFRGADLEKPR